MKQLALSLVPVLLVVAPSSAQLPFTGEVHDLGNATLVDVLDFGLGDLNGDGIPDAVVVANDFPGGQVEVVLSGPDGLASAQIVPDVPDAASPVLGDLDGDGDIDVVVGNSNETVPVQRVRIYLNQGDGTLSGPTPSFVGPTPAVLELFDFDLDGELDLVSALTASNELALGTGSGSGTFALPARIDVGARPTSLAVDDVNADGWPDVAVGLEGGVSVHLGDGLGGLRGGTTLLADVSVSGLVLADVGGATDLDLVVADPAGSIAFALGDGSGGFALDTTFTGLSFPVAPSLEVTDVDQDGRDDVLAFGGPGYLLKGLAGGGLAAPDEITADIAVYFGRVELADANGDGLDDVVVLRPQEDIAVFRGDGTGRFGLPRTATVADVHDTALGDVTGDGVPDFVTASRKTPAQSVQDAVTVVVGDGSGGFSGSQSYPLGIGASGVDVGDLDGDGWNDVVATAFYQTAQVAVLPGNGAGFPGAPTTYPSLPDAWDVRVGDVDGDGNADVVHGAFVDIVTLPGDGTGALGSPLVTTTTWNVFELELVDFDLDGVLDVYHTFGFDGAAVSWGDGTGQFTGTQNLEDINSYSDALAVADLNRDGLPDALVGTENQPLLYRWLNQGSRQFGPSERWFLASSCHGVATADFDGDGIVDVVTSDLEWSFLRGDGLGGLEDPVVFDGMLSSEELYAADVTGNGRAELVLQGRPGSDDRLMILPGLVGDPPGTERYGAGAAGCFGFQGLAASTSPRPAETLRLTVTQSPPNWPGLLLIGGTQDLAGTDSLAIGVPFHVDGPLILAQAMFTDVSGYGVVDLGVPDDPGLVGLEAFAQVIWFWGVPCNGNPSTYSGTNGLAIVVQP